MERGEGKGGLELENSVRNLLKNNNNENSKLFPIIHDLTTLI